MSQSGEPGMKSDIVTIRMSQKWSHFVLSNVFYLDPLAMFGPALQFPALTCLFL